MTIDLIDSGLTFSNSFAAQLQGMYTPFKGDCAPQPQLLTFNDALAQCLGFNRQALSDAQLARMLSGGATVVGSEPIAQAYSGHQFGGFNPRLGDGRALLLGEVVDGEGERHDIHLKGSGATVYSRGGDGKAALGPMLREYLLGEAMHALNIPTTRGLAVVLTGETVWREGAAQGAVLSRTAASHIRVGSFQYAAAQADGALVKRLADYTIARHYPQLQDTAKPYLGLLEAVCAKQAELVAKWVLVGFVHGVMNTDNMTVSGETIDYGPCAFIDNYDPGAVFSSIDTQGRYAYAQQPQLAQWNLARLAETLLALIDDDEAQAVALATAALQAFQSQYQAYWLAGMRAKLGLLESEEADDANLAADLLTAMAANNVDYTRLFRSLAASVGGDLAPASALFDDASAFVQWASRWQTRLARDAVSTAQRVQAMNAVNPIYIARNHLVEAALSAAEAGDYSVFDTLLRVLERPFDARPNLTAYELGAPPSFGPYRTFCGT